MKKIIIFCIFVLLSGSIFAEFIPPPLPSTPVYDEAGVLSAEERATLEQKILTLEKETSHQIGIAIIKSLQGRTIEEVSITTARIWGIGQKGLDNGLLILVALEERETRIEVGRGLEGVMTDLISDRIIEENFIPHFREGKYGQGLVTGIDRIIPLVRGEIVELPPEKNNFFADDLEGILIFVVLFGWAFLSILSASRSWWLGGVAGGIIGAIFLGTLGAIAIGVGGLVLDFFLSKFAYKQVPFLRSMGNNRWGRGGGFGGFGGGSSGGGWGGFGGGGFGGGGASGKW